MKKRITIICVLLVMVLITACFVSGTFAKYTSEAAGGDTATVAKWSILVGDENGSVDIASNDTVEFNLFDTVNDTDGTGETDVASGKIAPGTSGEFNFSIENASDVTAEYIISLEVTNANSIPIEFSLDDGLTWESEITGIDVQTLAIGDTDNINFQWRWAFEDSDDAGRDEADTQLGIVEAALSVKATITVDQVD